MPALWTTMVSGARGDARGRATVAARESTRDSIRLLEVMVRDMAVPGDFSVKIARMGDRMRHKIFTR
jgi:hypothetical protein